MNDRRYYSDYDWHRIASYPQHSKPRGMKEIKSDFNQYLKRYQQTTKH